MNKFSSWTFIVVLLFGSVSGSKAFAGAEAIAGGVLVENLVADIEDGLTTAIRHMETSATVVSFSVRSDLLVVLENVRQIADQLVGKTFDELNVTQKQFFERTSKLVHDVKSGVTIGMDEVDGVVSSMGEVISRLPTVDDRPYVTKYSPSYVVGGDESYRVSIKGSLVGSGKPTLSFGGHKCSLKTKTERNLEFDCPTKIFSEGSPWIAGELKVFEPKPWYAFLSDTNSFDYTISIRSVAESLGTYTLLFVTEVTKEVKKPREQANYHRNDHCQGDAPINWTYTPGANCKIDVSSVSTNATTVSSNSSFGGHSNVTENGFNATGVVRNAGSCGPRVFGQRAGLDGRGALGVTAKWVDVCREVEEVISEREVGDLFWKKQKSFQLPQNTKSFLLSIHQANGEERVVKGTEPHQWFNVDYDASSKVAVFRPNPIQEALK